MIGTLRRAIQFRMSLFARVLAFTAVLVMLIGQNLGVFYIAVTSKLLSTILILFIRLIAYFLGGIILYYSISDLPGIMTDPVESKDEKKLPGFLTSGSIPMAMNGLLGIGLVAILRMTTSMLMKPRLDLWFIIAAVGTLAAVIALAIFVLASWLIAMNHVSVNQYHLFLIRSIRLTFTRFSYILVSLIFISAVIVIFTTLDLILWPMLYSSGLSPLLVTFYMLAVNGTIASATFLFLVKFIQVTYGEREQFVSDKSSLAGLVLAGLFAVGIIAASLPTGSNIFDDTYNTMIAKAETYRQEDKLYLCGNEYKKAYALTKAYKGYLLDMQTQKDKDATDEQINRVMNEANVLFNEAYSFYPNAGLIYFLDGLRNLERNPIEAVNRFNTANQYEPELYATHFLALPISLEANNEVEIQKHADQLVKSGLSIAPASLNDLSYNKLTSALEKVDEYNEVCLENITTIAYDYYNNQLFSEAMAELMVIKEILPKDIVTNYLIAMTDLELKADNKAYTAAIEAAQTILDQYPNEEWARDLYTGVTLRAGNQVVMDEALLASYTKNPNDLDVAEQYAYSLLKKNYDSNYHEVTGEAEVVVDQILARDDTRWFAHYCKALILVYKGEYEGSIEHFNLFSEFMMDNKDYFAIYDELYNTYIVKYARKMTYHEAAREVLETSDHMDAFTYNYIMGSFGTMSGEFDTLATMDFLKQAIDYYPGFSKPYYMLGNACMELGTKNNDMEAFAMAEDYYYQSIGIFEPDPYAWFALGHAFKKQERYMEAMGAFQKTLSLMPTEDHQSDYFGVSIHSVYQINDLEHLVGHQGGE